MAKTAIASTTVRRVKPPDPGPIVYQDGVYDSTKSYTRTAQVVPMVMYGTDAATAQYYYLGKVGTFKGTDPKSDYAANGAKATWLLMERYKAAFFEILFANFANIAGAIFWGNKLFSQWGVDKNGNASNNYQGIVDGTFIPNLLLDWVNGRLSGNDVEIRGLIEAIAGRIGNLKIDSGGLTNYDSVTGQQFYGDAYIILRNDLRKVLVGLGTNLALATSGGSTIVMRAENGGTNSDGVNVGLNVSSSGSTVGNRAINIESGDIAGLAIYTRQINASTTLSQADVYISCYNSTNITITIPQPSAISRGKVYYVKRMNDATITVKTVSGNYIYTDIAVASIVHVSRGDTMMLVNDGQYWQYNYLPR